MKTQYKTSNTYDMMFRIGDFINYNRFILSNRTSCTVHPSSFLSPTWRAKEHKCVRNHFVSNDVGISGRKEIQCLYSFINVSLRFYYISMVLSCVGMKNAKSIENIICE